MNEVKANFGRGMGVIGETADDMIDVQENQTGYTVNCLLSQAGQQEVMSHMMMTASSHLTVEFFYGGKLLSGQFYIEDITNDWCCMLSSGKVEQVGDEHS